MESAQWLQQESYDLDNGLSPKGHVLEVVLLGYD